jgi:predicted secreted protein
MAKRVRVSADLGTTWLTLPGNTADFNDEMGSIEDTVFGQNFRSNQSGLIGWGVTANGLYKGFAGYAAKILKTSAVATIATGEAMSVITGKTYQVTDPTKRLFSPNHAVVVYAGGVAVAAANILNIDYLYGRVTFVGSYTPAGAVTVDMRYLTATQVAGYRGFTLTQTADGVDQTTIPDAQGNSGHRIFSQGLKTVSLELNGVYRSTNGFRAALLARDTLLIEVNPDGSSLSTARGFFKPGGRGQSGDVGALEEETITFMLNVPSIEQMAYPFAWLHDAGTTLNAAIRACLDAWANGTTLMVQYLPDGIMGHQGTAIVTDMSLSSGLEDMNEFAVSFQGTGAITAVT